MTLYQQSGVNLQDADSLVKDIGSSAKATFNKNTLTSIGGFAGLYKLPEGYKKPVLVGCTDGVGSKLKIAYENNSLEHIGQDLVAMCVNDLLCVGARPLYFLDYLATEKLDKETSLKIINSIARACKESNMALLGGETAELPGMLQKNAYELAGFCNGVVEEEKILNPENTEAGDILLGLPSSGLHSNGYSLVRYIIEKQNLDLEKNYNLDNSLIDELLRPTEIYVSTILPIIEKIKSLAHITGGGIEGNLPRAISKDLYASVNKSSWIIHKIFDFLQKEGGVAVEEMYKVFNMGLGMILVVSPFDKDTVCDYFKQNNKKYFEIGHLKTRTSVDKNAVVFS
ncbi:MAG: phosphoribosylformylglycinamidine cyclo-ligase [Candidatus Caenarcaniphilales bacterium]|nr:phosphoribosylformylglycinamidine cyclo-ligase [Candidatus Caenarcaniphilales bacterium]